MIYVCIRWACLSGRKINCIFCVFSKIKLLDSGCSTRSFSYLQKGGPKINLYGLQFIKIKDVNFLTFLYLIYFCGKVSILKRKMGLPKRADISSHIGMIEIFKNKA